MARICVIALIGLPGAGKTTFCQYLLTLPQLPVNIIHLCFDTFLTSKFENPTENGSNFEYKIQRSKILSLLQSVIDSLKKQSTIPEDIKDKISVSNYNFMDYIIICDDNNYYTSMRYKIYQMCKRNHIYFGQIYIMVDENMAMQRNFKREMSSQVPLHIVHQMIQRLEVPNMSKNAWESLTLTLDSNSCKSLSPKAIMKFFSNIFEHSLLIHKGEDAQEEHHIVSASHDLDLRLRRRIKEIIDSEPSVEVKRERAKCLNIKRRQILQSYENGALKKKELTDIDSLNNVCELLQ